MTAIIFFISIAISLIAKLIEVELGIDSEFHPDSIVYLTTGADGSYLDYELINNAYYYLSGAFSGDLDYLIAVNMIVFSITNSCAYLQYKKSVSRNKLIYLILFYAEPYRLHLSIHVLKDPIIILLLSLTIIECRLRYVYMLINILFRQMSIAYNLLLVRLPILNVAILVALFAPIVFDQVHEFLNNRMYEDMGGRSFVNLPSLTQSGLLGIYSKSIFWSFLSLTGLFGFFLSSLAYFPLALEMILKFSIISYCKKINNITIKVFLIAALFATFVSSFGAYMRYVYPMLCVWPLLYMVDMNSTKKRRLI